MTKDLIGIAILIVSALLCSIAAWLLKHYEYFKTKRCPTCNSKPFFFDCGSTSGFVMCPGCARRTEVVDETDYKTWKTIAREAWNEDKTFISGAPAELVKISLRRRETNEKTGGRREP